MFSVSKISTAVEKKEIVAREQDDSNPTEPLESVNDNVAPTNTIEDQNISKPVISNTDSSKKEKDKFDSDYEDNITIKMPQKENDTNFVSADTNKEQVSNTPLY